MERITVSKNALNQLLEDFVGASHVEIFKSMLQEHKAIISGSFVMRLLTNDQHNKDYDESDMDIYVKGEDNSKGILQYLDAIGFADADFESVCASIVEEYGQLCSCNMSLTALISSNKKVIQVCSMAEIIPKEALYTYDFTFLINYYDGNSVFSAFLDDIAKRSGNIFNINTLKKGRVIKYVNRGFTIEVNQESVREKSPDELTDKYVEVELV